MKDISVGWCHHTINFWSGCTSVSPECTGCRAQEVMQKQGEEFDVLRLSEGPWLEAELLNESAKARNTHELVFTCATSDFFHEQADRWRDEAWDVICRCQNLIWLILTKRPERIHKNLPNDWSNESGYPNVWLGTTYGALDSGDRVKSLRKVPCALKVLSCDPLMEDLGKIDLDGIGWILCGGISGKCSKDHPMDMAWAASLYDLAQQKKIPFLFKQISHVKPEQGINSLSVYILDPEAEQAEPESFDCIREYPQIPGFAIVPPEASGVRLSQAQWKKYMKRSNAKKMKQKKVPTGSEPEVALPAQHQAE